MTAQIIKFDPREPSTPDIILERAIGEFQNVVLIGYDHQGHLKCSADLNTSRKDILWMIEQFKLRFLLDDSEGDE